MLKISPINSISKKCYSSAPKKIQNSEQTSTQALNRQCKGFYLSNVSFGSLYDESYPKTSIETQVPSHHEINGYNNHIRAAVEYGDIAEEELPSYLRRSVEFGKDLIEQIDEEFKNLPPLEKDCIGYRGRAENPLIKRANYDFEIMDEAQEGDIVVPDLGYSYASFDRYTASVFGGHGARIYKPDGSLGRVLNYKIHIPKGAKVSRNKEHGGEFIMPRGAQYKILNKQTSADGSVYVEMEYILPKED